MAPRPYQPERLGMDEQDPQAPTVDTPAQSAPQGTPDAPQIDHEKRYNDLRSEFDRRNQQLNDEAYQRQLMAEWGYEVEDPEPVQETESEYAERLARLEQAEEARQAQAQQDAQLQQITSSVDQQFQATAPDLDPQTREWVTTRALNMDPRDDGMPDIAGAYQDFQAWEAQQQQKWEQARKRPRSPQIPPGGQAGTDAPNLDDRETRRRHMAEQLAAMDADS